jgi:hypothetical protein
MAAKIKKDKRNVIAMPTPPKSNKETEIEQPKSNPVGPSKRKENRLHQVQYERMMKKVRQLVEQYMDFMAANTKNLIAQSECFKRKEAEWHQWLRVNKQHFVYSKSKGLFEQMAMKTLDAFIAGKAKMMSK